MRILLPWQELQEAIATRLTISLAATAIAGRVFNYVPQDQMFPYLFFGEFESEDYSDKGNASLINFASFEIYSDESGSQQCQQLTKAAFACLTSAPLALSGNDHVSVGSGQMRNNATLLQEFNGVGIVWSGKFRVAFLTQQISQ